MRYLPVALVIVCGCQPGPAGPPGPQGPQGAPGAAADVSALVARLDAAERELAALKGAARVKVPHLIVKETGEDLGPFVDWMHAYDMKLGAYYQRGGAARYYDTADCSGTPYVEESYVAGLLLASGEEIVETLQDTTTITKAAYFTVQCTPYLPGGTMSVRRVRLTGSFTKTARLPITDLDAELR